MGRRLQYIVGGSISIPLLVNELGEDLIETIHESTGPLGEFLRMWIIQ